MRIRVGALSTIPSVFICFTFFFTITARAQDSPGIPMVFHEIKHDLSLGSLRDIAKPAQVSTGNRQLGQVALPTHSPFKSSETDPVAHVSSGPTVSITTALDIDGLDAAQTAASGGPFVPPDTNGAVGATQFVQWVNVTFEVFDKTTGDVVMGPTPGNAFWKGFGGACETRNDGDIIIQYDKLADRWVAAQPVFAPPFMYCLAVSTTSDATGSYNRYSFSFPSPNTNFPDYPKLGVWPDGYYVTANIFSPHSSGAMACALDRANILAGNGAAIVCFQEPSNVTSLLPSDLDGKTLPPPGSPNFMVGLADANHLNFFRFHVDFANPTDSTFIGPTLIAVAPFSEPCSLSTRACITEPNPGEKVDSLGDRVMYRLAYRNFGLHESLVVNHTIEGGAEAGVRWYEIRNPGSSPFVYQQGTIIDPNINYWMGSIAMDGVGNIALGFSASSSGLFPSVAVVGRVPSDPLGTMEAPTFLVTGGGVQVQSFRRWGDYSSMSVDPKDDCTFWYTQEYIKTTGSFDWSTRIASFKFNSCR
jgi:hypothetical protein